MKLRFFWALLSASLMATACSYEASPASEPIAMERQQMEDIVATIEDSTISNETLDDVCGRLFPDATGESDIRVGLVADVASIDDGTFNQAAFEGMESAGDCVGVETIFLEAAENDAEAQIASTIENDVDIVVTLGFQFEAATIEAALDYPDLRFIGIDQTNVDQLDNFVAIAFDDHQVGFLAGVTAGMVSESGTVAIVAGPDTVPPVVTIAEGFEQGVKHVAPETSVLRMHMKDFSDPTGGARQSQEFIEQGADVVFGAAGDTGTGAIESAAASGVHVIGVDQDEYFTTFSGGAKQGSSHLITSAIKRVDLGVFFTITAMATAEVEGGSFLLNAANGGVTYAPFHQADVPDDVVNQLEQIRRELALGNLSDGTDT